MIKPSKSHRRTYRVHRQERLRLQRIWGLLDPCVCQACYRVTVHNLRSFCGEE